MAREERNAARDKELGALFEINLEADTKLLEIRVAKKIARMELVAGTLGTKAEAVPQLRWMPKVGGWGLRAGAWGWLVVVRGSCGPWWWWCAVVALWCVRM